MFFRTKSFLIPFSIGILSVSPAWAKQYEYKGINIDIDSTFTYGVQVRVQGPQSDLTSGSDGSDGSLDNLAGVIDNAFLINGNDGNNNFAAGLVSNRASILTEMSIKWEDYGFFTRGKAWLDPVYANQATDNDDYETYNPNPKFGTNGGHNADLHEFVDRTEEYMGFNGRFLDAFVYGNFYLGDHTLSLRIGRQVISWGEAMLSGGGIATATNHVDAQVRNVPGLEIKEIFLPNGAVYAQFDLTGTVNIEAYYQYEWQPSLLDPSGSYFSEFDSIGYGGETFFFLSGTEKKIFGKELTDSDCDPDDDPDCAAPILKYMPGSGDEDNQLALVSHLNEFYRPKDDGQFGVALRYLFDSGGELGVYFVKYHDKIPSFLLPLNAMDAPSVQAFISAQMNPGLDPSDPAYRPFRGAQDLGSSMSSAELDTILGLIKLAEIQTTFSYGGYSDVINPNGLGVPTLDYNIKYFDNIRLYGLSYSTVLGTTNVAGEMTYRPNMPVLSGTVNRWPSREDYIQANINALHIFGPTWFYDAATLMAEGVAWTIPGRKNFNGDFADSKRLAVQNTAQGFGYSFLLSLDYKNIFQGVDLVVPIYVNHGVSGAMFNSGYRNKQVTFSIGLTAKYLAAVEFGIAYATYFGSKKDIFQRLASDRDNVSLNVKFGF